MIFWMAIEFINFWNSAGRTHAVLPTCTTECLGYSACQLTLREIIQDYFIDAFMFDRMSSKSADTQSECPSEYLVQIFVPTVCLALSTSRRSALCSSIEGKTASNLDRIE